MVTEGPAEVLARPARRARGAGSAARGGAGWAEPGAGGERRAGGRQDGAAGVCDRVCVGVPGRAGGRCGVRDGARVRGVCSSCARRCWIAWTGFLAPSGRRSGWRSGCVRGTRRIGFSSGLAVLSLFAEVAEERPLVCVVDDAQWLDRASAQALGVRGAAAVGGVGRAGVGDARARRSARGIAEARASRVCVMVMRARC